MWRKFNENFAIGDPSITPQPRLSGRHAICYSSQQA
jgi:hypothetical protein